MRLTRPPAPKSEIKKFRLKITARVILYDGVNVTPQIANDFLENSKIELLKRCIELNEKKAREIRRNLEHDTLPLKIIDFVPNTYYGFDDYGNLTRILKDGKLNETWEEIPENITHPISPEDLFNNSEASPLNPANSVLESFERKGTSVTVTGIKEGAHIKVIIE